MSKNKNALELEIYKATPISFMLFPFSENIDLSKLEVSMVYGFKIEVKDESVELNITVEVLDAENRNILLELKASFGFRVFDVKDVVHNENGTERLESKFARKLLNIAVGAIRGMLAVYLSSTEHKDFVLPLVNLPSDIYLR